MNAILPRRDQPLANNDQPFMNAQPQNASYAVPQQASRLPIPAPQPLAAAPAPQIDAIPVTYQPPAGEVVTFQVADGQRLSDAVRRFIAAHNLVLDWDTGGADFQVRFGYQVNGPSLDAVLLNVLTPFRLSAITRLGNGVIAVTRAS